MLQHQSLIVQQFERGPVRHHAAPVKDDGARAHFDHKLEIVRGNQLGGADPPQQGLELAPTPRIEVAGGLIEHQDRRGAGQHAGETGAALLTLTKMMGVPRAITSESYFRERAMHALSHLRRRQSQLLGPEGDILCDGRAEKLVVRVLEHQADLSANMRQPGARDRLAVDQHPALPVRRALGENTVEMKQQSGFARAIRSEQRHTFARREPEADAAQGLIAVRVTESQPVHFESRGHCHPLAHMAA